jgi:hypothetical protein
VRETDLVKQIQLAFAPLGVKLFRNNVGRFKIGSRYIQYGLCVGSSDLIGFTAAGDFVAIECKTSKGKKSIDQQNFIEAVNSAGGIAFFAYSVQEAIDYFNKLV